MYDCLLGGLHTVEIDQKYAELAIRAFPGTEMRARANRASLGRPVSHFAESESDQFISIGSGVPRLGNVHEVALPSGINPRVIPVSINCNAAVQSEAILAACQNNRFIMAGASQHELVLATWAGGDYPGLGRAFALIFAGVRHRLRNDAEDKYLVGAYRARLAPDSYIAISHATFEGTPRKVKNVFWPSASGLPLPHSLERSPRLDPCSMNSNWLHPTSHTRHSGREKDSMTCCKTIPWPA
jgi:hypothetical protein